MLLFLCQSLCPTRECIYSATAAAAAGAATAGAAAAAAAATVPPFTGLQTQLLWPSNIKTRGSPGVLQAFITKSELLKHPASQTKQHLGSWALQHTRLLSLLTYSNLTKTPLRHIFILSVLSL